MSLMKRIIISFIAVFFGFIHGYAIAYIKNKDRTEEVYQIVESNYNYELSVIKEYISKNDIQGASQYVLRSRNSNHEIYLIFLSENTHYIPLMER